MKTFLKTLSVVLLASFAVLAQEPRTNVNQFDHAEYLKPASGEKPKSLSAVPGTLAFDQTKKSVEFVDGKGSAAFSIKYDAIKSMLYERTSKPRYVAAILISPFFLFAHSKKHFLTIQYTDDAGAGQYALIHLDKKNARAAVAAAEAATGKKVEREEEK